MNKNVLDISKKTFINVMIVLISLLVFTTILCFIIPKGKFLETEVNGEVIVHYDQYIKLDDKKGVNIIKCILAPILVLASSDGLSLIMLSLFIMFITSAFQVMNDCDGMKIIIHKMISKFKNNKKKLIALITLIFMMFGSFFGLFEEVLILLPLIMMLTLSIGYDSYTGFLICIVATGFGFSSAITNPFTVITASQIIGVSPVSNIWYRVIIFMVMYGLLIGFVLLHINKITKDPQKSPTYLKDLDKIKNLELEVIKDNKRIFLTYVIFLLLILVSIIVITSIEVLRSYIVVFLIVIALFGGLISGYIASKDIKKVLKSFLKGIISSVPAIVMILVASSIKYILEEAQVLPTIANYISIIVNRNNNYLVIFLIFLIILLIEFFISSSTAKAVFVMGMLSCVSINISKEMLVLAYLFGDGYTNLLFPTSPVLLIALTMVGINYTTWLKRSKWLFVITFTLVILFLFLGLLIGY